MTSISRFKIHNYSKKTSKLFNSVKIWNCNDPEKWNTKPIILGKKQNLSGIMQAIYFLNVHNINRNPFSPNFSFSEFGLSFETLTLGTLTVKEAKGMLRTSMSLDVSVFVIRWNLLPFHENCGFKAVAAGSILMIISKMWLTCKKLQLFINVRLGKVWVEKLGRKAEWWFLSLYKGRPALGTMRYLSHSEACCEDLWLLNHLALFITLWN